MLSLKETYLNEGIPNTPSGPFKIGQFRGLTSLRERVSYLKTRTDVKFLSKGSSRVVFMIGDGKAVVKLSLYERGKAQNKTEYESVGCPNAKNFIPKMYGKSSDYSWIIVEPVDQFKSAQEFYDATGIPLKFVEIGITYVHPDFKATHKEYSPTYRKYKKIHDLLYRKSSWYKKLVNMANTCKLIPGDVGKFDSWGTTRRGRVVLLDPGVTDDVWNQYYE